MIKIKNLNKYYNKNKNNEIHVIKNINLEIESSGLVTILGPSGAGKSTFLHVVGGLDKAKGDIIYDEINLLKGNKNNIDTYRNNNIGYIFQNYNLLPNLTVYENLLVQLELVGIKEKEQVDKKIDEALKIVGLERYKRRKVTALSGGQQQRVSIARALVKGAKIIIADEPTGNLDTKNTIEILNILKILSKKYLVLLVTHNITLAKHYADRIITIKDGEIVNDQINKNNNSLLHSDSNAIYLKEYHNTSYQNENNLINIYSKENEHLNFKIVIDNGVIYIENNSSLPIRVLDENTDRYIIDSEYDEEVIDENTILNLDYHQTSKTKSHNKFKYFIDSLKSNLIKVFNVNKKTKLIYFSFILIGIILCLCLNALSISTKITNDYLLDTPKNAIRMDIRNASADAKYGYKIQKNSAIEIFNNTKSINGIVETIKDVSLLYKVINNRDTLITIDDECFVTTSRIYNGQNLYLKDNEIVISDMVANKIINYTKWFDITTYDKLKGQKFKLNMPNIVNQEVIIKDIIPTSDYTFILSDYMYFATTVTLNTGSYLNYFYDKDNKYFSNYTPYVAPEGGVYKKNLTGVDAVVSKNLIEYLIGIDYFASTGSSITYWQTNSAYFNIIGYVEEEGFDVVFKDEIDYYKFIELTMVTANSYLPYDNYDIILGNSESTIPLNDYEIMLPYVDKYITEYPIGSIYKADVPEMKNIDFKVVGYFETNYPLNTAHFYVNYRTATLINIPKVYERLSAETTKEIYFYANDIENAIESLTNCGYPTYDAEKQILAETIFAKIDVSKLIIVMSITILIVMIIFVFFINRSKMMQNIYELGVLRALGAKKSSIYKDYFIESILVSTLTIVLGFSFAFFFTYNAENFVSGISVDLIYYFISLVLIYLIMIVASIMPIYLLLKKTPIEIINKYDI